MRVLPCAALVLLCYLWRRCLVIQAPILAPAFATLRLLRTVHHGNWLTLGTRMLDVGSTATSTTAIPQVAHSLVDMHTSM